MLELEHKIANVMIKSIWFSDYPFDVENCDVVQFYSCKNNVDFIDFSKFENPTLIIDLTQDLDLIWKNMCQSTRRSINKATRDGVKIKQNENYKEFIQINKDFRRKKNLPRVFFTEEYIKNNATLFAAEFNGEIIVCQMYLEDEYHIYWEISSSKRLDCDDEKAKLIAKANRLLVWEAIKYAKDKGIKEFDLGGYHIGDNVDPSMKMYSIFKERFGGKVVVRYNYKKYYSRMCKLAIKTYKKFR